MRVHSQGMATFAALIAANIRAWRSRRGLSQATVVARMRALGFDAWHRQTISNVERGDRRVTAEELVGLALAMEVSIPALTTASDQDDFVELPNGMKIGAISLERLAGRGVNDHAVQWPDGGTSPWVGALHPQPGADPFDRTSLGPAMSAQGWPDDVEVPPRER